MPSRATAVFFIPSFYGAVAWSVAWWLYSIRYFDWFPSTAASTITFGCVCAAFWASSLFWSGRYSAILGDLWRQATIVEAGPHREWYVSRPTILVFHVIGLAGLVSHFFEYASAFGGVEGFLYALYSFSQLIRVTELDPLSVYLSYFGWIGIVISVLTVVRLRRPDPLLIGLSAVQFIGNLMFIDRTRPTWIAFCAIVACFPFLRRHKPYVYASLTFGIMAFGVAAFTLIGGWLGKTTDWFTSFGYTDLEGDLGLLYFYLTCSFAYFDSLVFEGPPAEFSLERTLYPLFKVLSLLGFVEAPPPQILPFINSPFPSNTGTFLEPFYSDGGWFLLIAGTAFATFCVDYIALRCLKSRDAFLLLCWANLCFCSFIAFFVPKLTTAATWLFFAVGLVSAYLGWARRKRWHITHQPAATIVFEHGHGLASVSATRSQARL